MTWKEDASCPVDGSGDASVVTLAHGEGARLTRQLIHRWIAPAVTPEETQFSDAAIVEAGGGLWAISTDCFVVDPLFFPGGDIGSLAIFGTVNDLAVAGAVPRWITLALIIEEGLPLETLKRVLSQIRKAAKECGVKVVAGDTKVVPRGAADKLFINTTGVGELLQGCPPGASSLEEGDALIVSGPLGRHGIAVMSARESMGFSPQPSSDSAPLHEVTAALIADVGDGLVSMRDATRGGVAAVLHEWSEVSGHAMVVRQDTLPVDGSVRGVCELLGIDPIHVANEGTFVLAVKSDAVAKAIEVMKRYDVSADAVEIGCVGGAGKTGAMIESVSGVRMPIDDPAGAPLPRIC